MEHKGRDDCAQCPSFFSKPARSIGASGNAVLQTRPSCILAEIGPAAGLPIQADDRPNHERSRTGSSFSFLSRRTKSVTPPFPLENTPLNVRLRGWHGRCLSQSVRPSVMHHHFTCMCSAEAYAQGAQLCLMPPSLMPMPMPMPVALLEMAD